MADKPDAIALLKADHRKVEDLFEKFESAPRATAAREDRAEQICMELTVHTQIEEEIFYPACEGKVEEDLLKEAYVEHDGAKVLIAEIEAGGPDDEFYDAKVKVLSEQIEHHVEEEEKRDGGHVRPGAQGRPRHGRARRPAARAQGRTDRGLQGGRPAQARDDDVRRSDRLTRTPRHRESGAAVGPPPFSCASATAADAHPAVVAADVVAPAVVVPAAIDGPLSRQPRSPRRSSPARGRRGDHRGGRRARSSGCPAAPRSPARRRREQRRRGPRPATWRPSRPRSKCFS